MRIAITGGAYTSAQRLGILQLEFNFGMIVVAVTGDRCDATVTAIHPGKSIELSLESAETATMLWRGVAGKDDNEKLERALSLRIGSTVFVDVIDVHEGRDFKRKILVREVSWTRERPARKKNRARRKNPHGGRTHTTRDGIRVWRAD